MANTFKCVIHMWIAAWQAGRQSFNASPHLNHTLTDVWLCIWVGNIYIPFSDIKAIATRKQRNRKDTLLISRALIFVHSSMAELIMVAWV